uniref:Uncharacterized protein n=1 Tax=Anguilla anguilla TaxID=7936 RepID=A0A0E9XSE5_ANGAN
MKDLQDWRNTEDNSLWSFYILHFGRLQTADLY